MFIFSESSSIGWLKDMSTGIIRVRPNSASAACLWTVEEMGRVRHRGIRGLLTLGRRHSRFAVWPARRVILTGIVIVVIDARTRLERRRGEGGVESLEGGWPIALTTLLTSTTVR